MKYILLGLSFCSFTLFASTTPLHVSLDIYANAAFLNKTYTLTTQGSIVVKVPSYSKLESIKYDLSSTCKTIESSLSNTIKIEDEQIKTLYAKKDNISYKLSALSAKEALLKSLSLKDISDTSKIDKISSYLTQNLIQNSNDISALKKELLNTEELLRKNKKISYAYKRFQITYECKTLDQELTIKYPQRNLRYVQFYEINANLDTRSVDINKKINLTYKGIENFDDIDLNLYSYGYNQNVVPQIFYPKYLGEKKEILYQKARFIAPMSKSANMITSPKIVYADLATKSVYTIKNANLKYGEKNVINVDSEKLTAKFPTTIDAYGTNKAYLEAVLKTNKNYSSAIANFSLNGKKIASRRIQRLQKGKITKLYFGEDEHVQIKKELIKTLNDKTFFGDTRVSTQNWSYKITNTKKSSVDVNFIERVPVSKDANIAVKTLATPKYTNQKANGKTTWKFSLKPNETKNIIFGYEISSSK